MSFFRRKRASEDPRAQIVRHAPPGETDAPAAETPYAAEIVEHVERHLGPVESVFHELISDRVHLDVLYVDANPPARDFKALVTSGMSAAPMTMPPDMEDGDQWNRAELVIYLPSDWPIGDDEFADEANYWPVRWLKTVAHLPHLYRTFFLPGHTIPVGDPPEPVADSAGFTGFVIWPGVQEEADFRRLVARDGQPLHFWSLLPLYTSEMDHSVRRGFDSLVSNIEKRPFSLVVDVGRPAWV